MLLILALLLTAPAQNQVQLHELEGLIEQQPEEALSRLKILVAENPSPDVYFLLARAWARMDARESLPWLEKIFQEASRHERAWQLWADIMTETRQYEYAVLRLQQQLRKDPEFAYPRLLLAQIHVNRGDLEHAEAQFRQVIETAPEASPYRTRALYSLAYLLVSENRFLEAQPVWREAIERDSAYASEMVSLARGMADHDHWLEASRLLADLVRRVPENRQALFLLGRSYAQLEKWPEALSVLADLLTGDPEHMEAHYYAGRACRELGQHEQAIEHFRRFRELNTRAHLRGVVSLFKVDPEELRVTELLKKMADHADPEAQIFLNDQRAEMYAPRVRQEIDPSRKTALRIRMAWELLRAGRNQEAIDEVMEIRRILDSGQTFTDVAELNSVGELLALSYLRLGEQQNCFTRHNADSCLMPIAGEGVHVIQGPSELAAQEFSSLLRAHPNDLGYRWLLNLTYMTLGKYPRGVPDPWLIPPGIFESDYGVARFHDIAPARGVAVSGLAGGSILEDFDGDGHLDLMASSWGFRDQLRYFHNNGDGTFSDWTEKAGLTGQWGGINLSHADYDNDGYPDVLVLRGGWLGYLGIHQGDHPNSLLHNRGDGTFTDVTAQAGLLGFHPSHTAAWADYDLDGWLDVFIGNESAKGDIHPLELFHNNGDGTFTDVALEVGIDAIGVIKGVAWGDYDRDGYADLYLSRFDEDNLLYHNDGRQASGWRFTEVSGKAGVKEPRLSFPTWFWDYDNDGREDILVASFASYFEDSLSNVVADYIKLRKVGEYSRLYRNNGDGTFQDVSREVKLDAILIAMGANFGDLDNDGFLDCYFGTGQPNLKTLIPNQMFRNWEGRRFQDVTTAGGFGHLQKGHGISFGDIDNDGDQDIYAVFGGAYSGDFFQNALFLNPGNSNRWITLRLEGVRSNRFGVGAHIKINVDTQNGERTIYATVGTGGSFGASSLQQEIGLGQAVRIRSIEIRWPTKLGSVQVLKDVPLNQIIRVREGEGVP